MNQKISIIVPIYNAEKYISRCVDSILNQTYSNIELILVNDGSEDNSFEIMCEYEKKDPRIVLVNKTNTGVGNTRNEGINKSTGEYIGFVDADDYIEPNMYEKLYEECTNNHADIVCCGYKQEYRDFYYELSAGKKIVLNGADEILSYYLRQDIRNGIGNGNWNKLFRKETLNSIRYKEYANGEDIEFQYNAFKSCKKVVCIPDILYHYRMNDSSASNSVFNKKKISILRVADDILADAKAHYNNISTEAYAFNLTWKLSLLQNIYESKKTKESTKTKDFIISSLKDNYIFFKDNPYSKRLDQIYLKTAIKGLMKPTMIFRKLIRSIIPSKDRKKK